MTSNIGTSYISDQSIPEADRFAGVEQELKMFFKPEFLNRIDETIIFNPLTRENIASIVKNQLADVAVRLKERGISLEMTQRFLDFLVKEGYDPQFGARPLKRAIQAHILNPLSMKLLSGEMKDSGTLKIDIKGGEVVIG
jgi:ATP-dependent Clp protease ATP-binding subunit ClpB